MVMLGLFIFLLLLAGGLVEAIAVLRWIARPMDSLVQSRRCRTQFTVADILVLFATLQGVVGTVHYLLSRGAAEPGSAQARDDVASTLFADSVVAAYLLLSWWAGVVMVSRAGISRWWHRAIVLGIVAPGTTISVPATVVLTWTTVAALFEGPPSETLTVLGLLCVALAVVGVCGALTRWVASKSPLCESANQSGSEDVPGSPSPPAEE